MILRRRISTRVNTFPVGEVRNYEYTGVSQQVDLIPGTYKIECWGAQGGSITTNGVRYIGGKGGYSIGKLTLSESTTVYVVAGGQGTNSTETGLNRGGAGGGGAGYTPNPENIGCGGGGSSTVSIGQNSIYARVIVAGGGGGACSYSASTKLNGGAGGGTNGLSGAKNTTNFRPGSGGDQDSGGTSFFGPTPDDSKCSNGRLFSGGSVKSGVVKYAIAGGGGGWYGGGGSFKAGGGGGSGYVYTSSTASNYPRGCLLNSSHYLADAQTIAGNASMPSTSGGTETGHSGNGYVRITRIS